MMTIIFALLVMLFSSGCGQGREGDMTAKPSHYTENGFRNTDSGLRQPTFRDFLRWVFIEQRHDASDAVSNYQVEVEPDAGKRFHEALGERFTVTWLGHSSIFVQMNGLKVLIDPVWSERASPFSWLGPRRHTPPPIMMEDIPPVDAVLISHNHYDHLDIPTLIRLGNAPLYLVPLGVGKILSRHGITNFHEMDWWDTVELKGIKIACLPAQHFSARSPFDRNRTLWCGWAVMSNGKRFYDAGDTGYFSGFREIGERFGPFDAAAIPIGAYLPKWFMEPMHIGPQDAIRAAEDLGARIMIPIHWGVFNLADDPFNYSPSVLDKIKSERSETVPRIEILRLGETRIIHQ